MWSTSIVTPQRLTTLSHRKNPLPHQSDSVGRGPLLRPKGFNLFLMIMQNHLKTIYISADEGNIRRELHHLT